MRLSNLAFSPTERPAFARTVEFACERIAALLSATVLLGVLLPALMAQSGNPESEEATGARVRESAESTFADNETVASIYAGAPLYHRSNAHLRRPDGTDLTLQRLGWNSDPLYFPLDGGVRAIRWMGSVGVMVDFLHNKAIARVGKGSHGRRISNGVVEDVTVSGTLKGRPPTSPLKLTDLVDRLEFTHGHNMLLVTGLARLAPLSPRIRPYLGVGAGVTLPHIEVWFTGEQRETRTNEYQYTGPALQFLAGIELRIGRGSYYAEYKLLWSSIDAALTGGKSWSLKDARWLGLPRWLIEPFVGLTEMPGDLWRQFERWRKGEAPGQGFLATHLVAHGFYVGGGRVWPAPVPATTP